MLGAALVLIGAGCAADESGDSPLDVAADNPVLPDEPSGSTSQIDRLYGACDDGDMDACDNLFLEAPLGSDEEAFGDSCGGRQEPDGSWCGPEKQAELEGIPDDYAGAQEWFVDDCVSDGLGSRSECECLVDIGFDEIEADTSEGELERIADRAAVECYGG